MPMPGYFLFLDKNLHFCYVLGNGFAMNRPIYESLSFVNRGDFAEVAQVTAIKSV